MRRLDRTVQPVPFGPERAERLWAQRGWQNSLGRSDLTVGESNFVRAVWDTMAGGSCWMDAFHRIRQGKLS